MPSENDDSLEERLRAAHVGDERPEAGRVVMVDHDPAWCRLFEREAARIRATLGAAACQLEHVGSTSVPGLAAKPIVDIVLAVDDSGNESGYVPHLEAAGYQLRIREPDWFEHRMFKGPDTEVNLHVFSVGCAEISAMLRFRDHLRGHDEDRALYERTKRQLARQEWNFVQEYADAKSKVVREILARAGWPSG